MQRLLLQPLFVRCARTTIPFVVCRAQGLAVELMDALCKRCADLEPGQGTVVQGSTSEAPAPAGAGAASGASDTVALRCALRTCLRTVALGGLASQSYLLSAPHWFHLLAEAVVHVLCPLPPPTPPPHPSNHLNLRTPLPSPTLCCWGRAVTDGPVRVASAPGMNATDGLLAHAEGKEAQPSAVATPGPGTVVHPFSIAVRGAALTIDEPVTHAPTGMGD